jgi:hypothetical protein
VEGVSKLQRKFWRALGMFMKEEREISSGPQIQIILFSSFAQKVNCDRCGSCEGRKNNYYYAI